MIEAKSTGNQLSSDLNFSRFIVDFKDIFTKDLKFISFAFILAFITHIILWLAYPLHWGPDGPNYIYYYIDFFNKEPLFPMILAYRTPVSPLFYGFLLDIGGNIAASVASEILSLILIPAIYLIALSWGKNAARTATILFILFLPFQIQFHQISSDALFSWFFILFFLSFKYALENKNTVSWSILGIISGLTILTRPSGLVIILALASILFLGLNFKKILKLAGVYLLCIIVLLGSFIIFKGARYNDYGLSRGSNYTAFMRVYTLQEPLWDPANGPYSEKLVKMVEENLLNTNLYKKYNITLEKVLENRHNRRILGDIIVTVDRVEGWKTEYDLLKRVAFESIKASPVPYFKNYLKDVILLFTIEQTVSPVPDIKDTKILLNDIQSYSQDNLPELTEGELIPFSNTWWMLSRPDGTLPNQAEMDGFNSRYEKLIHDIDNPKAFSGAVRIVEILWNNIKIPIFYFWLLGIIAMIFSKGNRRILPIYIYILSIIIIIGTLYAAHVYTRYRLPLDPLIMICGVAGLFSIIERIRTKTNIT